MDFDFELLRAAFSEQGTIFVRLVDDTSDLATLTALGDWDCAVLIGHVNTAVEVLWRWKGEAPNGAPEIDAVGWWDVVDAGTNDSFSKRYAAKRSHDELRELIRSSVERATDMLPSTAPEQPLVAPGGLAWTRFDHGLATRIVELTVHGLDLAAATRSTTAMSPSALAVVGSILDQRLIGTRPSDIDDDARWVAAATGRTSHRDPRLPVLS